MRVNLRANMKHYKQQPKMPLKVASQKMLLASLIMTVSKQLITL